MAVAVGATTIAGFRLHTAADLERQTLRIQKLGGAVFRLQDFTLRAQGPHSAKGLARSRAAAVAAADVAFGDMQRYDHGDGARIGPAYRAYLTGSKQEFDFALQHRGRVANPLEQRVERQLTQFADRVNTDVGVDAQQSRQANPKTRLVLVIALAAIALLIAGFVWQFNIERRAGRIDRDNARRTAELARLRDEFVAAVSHELRTPLTSIIGYLELLRDAKPGESLPSEADFLEVVQRNADRLLRLVNDLLFVAQVDGGGLSLELRHVNLSALARESVDDAQLTASAKQIELTFQDGSRATEVEGDPVRLAQMIDNLVSNAVKFTPRGGRVTVTATDAGADVLVEVADSGAGISPSDQTQLYDRFFRAHSAATEAAPGTGLGLTITKAIVDAHRGSIDVESTVGVGTTFRVRLPQSRAT